MGLSGGKERTDRIYRLDGKSPQTVGEEGDFDNDRSVESYLEDVDHFLRVATALAQSDPAVLTGPAYVTRLTPDDPARWHGELRALEKRLNLEEELEEDMLDPGLRRLAGEVLPAFHRLLLNWHCLRFFPFHQHLSPAYLAYLDIFLLGIAEDHRRTFLLQGKRDYFLSAYTFSHRVKGSRLNSARLSYGAASATTPELRDAASAVLRQEGVQLPAPFDALAGDFTFYGLGWDFGVSPPHLKVYLHGERRALPPRFEGALRGAQLPGGVELMGHVLIAFTVSRRTGDMLKGVTPARVIEEKLYVYPKEGGVLPDTPKGVLNVAFVVSGGEGGRGVFQQWDVTHTEAPDFATPEWRGRFSSDAQRVYDEYYRLHMRLDTLGYAAPDDCTLYFPFEP